jgi:MarR family transcriptional regulator for hemolysin
MTTPASSPPPVDLSFLLNQSSYSLSARMTDALAGLGISVREYCVLTKAAEEERTQNVVAELAALDKTTMVVTLDRLEQARLAERRVSRSDRRARVIGVTPRGRKVLGRAHGMVRDVYDEVLGVLPDEQRSVFLAALHTLTDGPLASPSHLLQPVRRRGPQASATP